MQLLPYGSILTIFASNMASTPLLVLSENLDKSLPAMRPHPAPFDFMRTLQQDNIDELHDLRHAEVNESSKCIANPKEMLHPESKRMVPVPVADRMKIEAFNRESREVVKTLLGEDKKLVCEWIVNIDGVHRYMAARMIQIFLNLFMFLLQMAVVFLPESSQKYVFSLSLLVLIPLSLLEALSFVKTFGGSLLRITDMELERELKYFRCLVLLFAPCAKLFRLCCSCFYSNNSNKDMARDDNDTTDKSKREGSVSSDMVQEMVNLESGRSNRVSIAPTAKGITIQPRPSVTTMPTEIHENPMHLLSRSQNQNQGRLDP